MTRIAFVLAAAASFALVGCAPPAAGPTPDSSVAAVVETPQADARVTSPLRVSGVAPANWYFENQFPVRLVDAQGEEIAYAPATPRVNWTEPGDKEFDAELVFDVQTETPATLVLEEDMPRPDSEPRQTRVPVVLLPN